MNKIDEETLWNMMRFLYPNLTLDDFYETLELEGWYNTLTRIQINLKNRYELIDKYGGDGLGRYRELYKDFKNGGLDKKIDSLNLKKKRWKRLLIKN